MINESTELEKRPAMATGVSNWYPWQVTAASLRDGRYDRDSVGIVEACSFRANNNHSGQRLMRYLRGSMDYAIEYSGFSAVLEQYSDANWISDSDETKSTSGYVFTLGGGAITWRSFRQTIFARSTMKYEIVALKTAGNEADWLKNFLANISIGMKPTPLMSIHCDCQSATAIAKNKNLVKQLLKSGTISIDYVKSERNLAVL
ncbi:hypothetical protein V8G54_012696 [Vigna mungo]|uniref:Retrovirus-related Pol polyprotein from transposon TNT 1-94 n=1 Tax=Vigna mungo TaxID=3915 RepID=A0AAQ3NTP7_VIGMU